MARRREVNVFSWSFLDAITCGFGAVVLTFVIISAQVAQRAEEQKSDLTADSRKLEEEVLDARKNLVRFRNTVLQTQEDERTRAADMARIKALLTQLQLELETTKGDSLARQESIEKLRADVKQLEEANQRLAARQSNAPATGERVRSFVGEGNRQYLTGLKVGGKRILILVDTSTSMLARDYINVLRFRSMDEAARRNAPKWRQAVRTVDWITTQIPPDAQFQIYAFDEQAHSVVEGTDGKWLSMGANANDLTAAVGKLRKTVPAKGTSLVNAFTAVGSLSPAPDTVWLLTDGLPTMAEQPPAKVEAVDPNKRKLYFDKARRAFPSRIPLNVLLFPMDGDPEAAFLYWDLAIRTGGALLTPSEGWP